MAILLGTLLVLMCAIVFLFLYKVVWPVFGFMMWFLFKELFGKEETK